MDNLDIVSCILFIFFMCNLGIMLKFNISHLPLKKTHTSMGHESRSHTRHRRYEHSSKIKKTNKAKKYIRNHVVVCNKQDQVLGTKMHNRLFVRRQPASLPRSLSMHPYSQLLSGDPALHFVGSLYISINHLSAALHVRFELA